MKKKLKSEISEDKIREISGKDEVGEMSRRKRRKHEMRE